MFGQIVSQSQNEVTRYYFLGVFGEGYSWRICVERTVVEKKRKGEVGERFARKFGELTTNLC